MKFKRGIAVLAVVATAGVLVAMPSANAASGVFTSNVGIGPVTAQAYNLIAVGALVNIPPVDPANCAQGQNVDITAPTVTVPQIATVNALASTCLIPLPEVPNNTQATASAAKVSLLNGAIVITGVRTQCFTNSDGVVTAESTVATVNGLKVSLGAVNITIPGIATIALDQNSQNPAHPVAGQITTVRSVGVLVQVLPHTVKVLGKSVNIPAQTISVDTCSITGYAN
jgi:hypothetical protein